uniref:Uncharacterized protein n=1 Tax=Rhizophora mucronata TaxID=61149 RepID=A0A2P2P867_RHIMU
MQRNKENKGVIGLSRTRIES